MSASSSPPQSPVPSSAEDETLHLALTLLSLPSTSTSTPRPPAAAAEITGSSPHPSSSPTSSPSSAHSWMDLPPMPSSERSATPANRTNAARRRSRKSGVRAGLSHLPNPPSPFGSQLGVLPPSRSTPYHHRHEHNYFDPRPTQRTLGVENDQLPLPEPEYVYDTALCALHSAANLARSCADIAVETITQGGKKSLAVELAKVGLGVCVVLRPRWVLGAMNWSLSAFRDPWRFYHHAFYAWLIARFVTS